MANPTEIKVVDFSGIKTGVDVSLSVMEQLHEAFSTIGFVIIVNHGIEEKVIKVTLWPSLAALFCMGRKNSFV